MSKFRVVINFSNGDTEELDDLFEIHFHAVQYNGETLQQYVEPEP